ncbi:helix-turn-helix domain-containing protein [Tenacibaculum jejuense]|nr:helix-turn-helix domain-containing protein [Tenacibaculum jejuense]
MYKTEYILPKDILPYVNCIMIGSNTNEDSHTNIPLYADGYPGIMYQSSDHGFYLLPKEKKLSELFLYGQTLQPISLDVKGAHEYIVVQLYPFASKYLLGIAPKVLNDDCYDLLQLNHVNTNFYRNELVKTSEINQQISTLFNLIRSLIKANTVSENAIIERVIRIIIEKKGQIKVKEILEIVPITERTLERNFMNYVGLTPKQFARIIQFQSSIHLLSQSKFDTLLDVGLDSGFSDQSHFIRTFKSYTGQTPKFYLNQIA